MLAEAKKIILNSNTMSVSLDLIVLLFLPLQWHLFGQIDLSLLLGKCILLMDFSLSALLYGHMRPILHCIWTPVSQSLRLLWASSSWLMTSQLLFRPSTIHLKRKQEMTTLYSPQWWLCLMLNLHYSYWNKSLSSAIHHQRRRSFSRTWKTQFKKKKKRKRQKQLQLTSAAINHRFPA